MFVVNQCPFWSKGKAPSVYPPRRSPRQKGVFSLAYIYFFINGRSCRKCVGGSPVRRSGTPLEASMSRKSFAAAIPSPDPHFRLPVRYSNRRESKVRCGPGKKLRGCGRYRSPFRISARSCVTYSYIPDLRFAQSEMDGSGKGSEGRGGSKNSCSWNGKVSRETDSEESAAAETCDRNFPTPKLSTMPGTVGCSARRDIRRKTL